MPLPASVLILPGYGNSGPQHWQTLWQQSQPGWQRVQQRDWEQPLRDQWVAQLEEAAARCGPDVVLVAHSLACLVVAHWAAGPHSPVRAALLVAVPDPAGLNFPAAAQGFAATPTAAFDFSSLVVVSSDDPYGTPGHAEALAKGWGSRVVQIGARGHINADSGLGVWPEGLALLAGLA